jgi:hypothetical protein
MLEGEVPKTMLRWISILAGLLIMMGHHTRSELFYYFRLEDQVPETHLLRLIDKHISFAVRAGATERQLQRGRTALDRSRTPAAHAVDRVSIRHHQRAEAGGRATHALGVALGPRNTAELPDHPWAIYAAGFPGRPIASRQGELCRDRRRARVPSPLQVDFPASPGRDSKSNLWLDDKSQITQCAGVPK